MSTGTSSDLAELRQENPLTLEFLDDSRSQARAVDYDQPSFKRFRSWFTRPLLGRPALLEVDEVRVLDNDLRVLLQVLQALPERLFAGDRVAFAEHLGWTGPALPDLLRRLSGPAVPLGCADLVRSADGFKFVEFNTSSSLGSFEFGELCRATLQDPALAEFSADVDYRDPLRLMADTMLEYTGRRPSDRPVIALTKWVTSPVAVNPSLFVDLMADLGFDLVVCRIDELEYRDGAVHCGGRRIDVLYRAFLLKTAAADPRAAEILEPVARAVADGAVDLFAPLDADLYGTKSCLAMLSDPRNRDVFAAQEREVIDRTLPWTRRLADEVTDVDGQAEPLLAHVAANRSELVLKPSIGHAGQGVVAGWLTEQDEWEAKIRAAAAVGDHIVQRRARSEAPLVLDEGIGLVVVGALTHAFSLSRPATRREAALIAPAGLVSTQIGAREWLESVEAAPGTQAIAFDTRADSRFAGHAAHAATRLLRKADFRVLASPVSFCVEHALGPLAVGELDRARLWAGELAAAAAATAR